MELSCNKIFLLGMVFPELKLPISANAVFILETSKEENKSKIPPIRKYASFLDEKFNAISLSWYI